ncbi:hypothetical protein [Streptomyces sp. NPDC051310]|uniref:hypothetical protein n=1 Tax=Streptomyces sp. NPDC051310 TaxID=3365649 RepID=UPI0037AE7C35
MRTTSSILAACLLAASLGGCSGGGDAKAKPSPSPTPTVSPDERFLAAVHAETFESWADKGPTDEELVSYPPQWCSELKKGHSVEHLLSLSGANLYPIGMDWGTKKQEAQELVVLGVQSHCPELREQVTQDLRQSGGY